MRTDKYMMAKAWMKQDQAPQAEALETWNTLEAEFNEERKAMLMASAETDKIKEEMNKKFGPGTVKYGSELPPIQNPFKDFEERNPAANGGRMNFDNGGGADKYITPAKRIGADDFQGQKFISVKDKSYSEGRKRVKTKEYSAWLKNEQEKHKKDPNRYKQMSNPRREPGLIRIAEAMQQADINDDAEFMMPDKKAIKAQEKYFDRKMKVFKKGMLEAADIVYINNLERNFDDVIFIADQLGEDPDWVLDMLDERTNFRDFSKGEKSVLKESSEYKKPRNDYLKVENWVQKNAKRYANPETFENALIKRFGKNNQFVKDMNSSSKQVKAYFSDGFKKTMLNTEPNSYNTGSQLKQFIKSSLYNFNPKIKNAITEEIKGIFNSENLPKLRTESRKLLSNNKLLAKFGLDKAITGPFAKVIQAEIGQQMWDDITNFRQHRVGTQEMLKAFEQIVPEEFKSMFNESAKAIGHSKNSQWAKAKEVFGIADNIAWDHKVPSSLIDKGYADIIEYTKVNPTTSDFNERIKNAQFDRPINKLVTKFEKATTLDAKAKIKNEMDTLKNNFSEKYSGYLDEVSINLDEKGNLKFSSSAKPLTMGDERVAMLGKSLVQEGKFTDKEIKDIIKSVGCPNFKAAGGRIEFSEGKDCFDKGQKLINNGMKGASPGSMKNAAKFLNNAYKFGRNVMKFGIIPEAIFVGAESIIRAGGDQTLDEGFKSAIGFYLDPILGTNFKSDARISQNLRNMTAQDTMDLEKLFKFNTATENLNKLKENQKNVLNVYDESLMGGVSEQDYKKQSDANIAKAQEELNKNFLTETQRVDFENKADTSEDIKGVRSPFRQAIGKARSDTEMMRYENDFTGMQSDMFTQDPMSAKAKKDSLSNLLPQKGMTPRLSNFVNFDDRQLEQLSGLTKKPVKELQAYQEYLNKERAMSLLEQEKIFGKEQTYGTQGNFFGEQINKKPMYDYAEGGITGLRSKYEYKK